MVVNSCYRYAAIEIGGNTVCVANEASAHERSEPAGKGRLDKLSSHMKPKNS